VNAGVMHACGHDIHASWAVGAAYLLAANPAAGDVLVVLQPAEETGEGAAAVLQSGALDEVAAIFGAHVDRRFTVGQVVAQAGSLAAAADTFTIVLHGRGAHGARPHESADPVLGAGLLIAALQGIVSRRVNPSAPAVLTVATMNAGTASNVIPERATIGGTLRATDPVTRALLADELRRVAQGIALAHDLTAEVSIELGPPPIVNPEQQALWARHAAAGVLSPDAVVPLGITNMGGEDFAYYMERIPGAFLRIGAREPGGEPTPAHTPRFFAADGCLFVGAAVLAETARVASAALAHEG
jgi:hippurate hydrolase